MESLEVRQFIAKAKAKNNWPEEDFLLLCKEGVELSKRYPQDKAEIAYEIVQEGMNFGGFEEDDTNEARQAIRDLAADLELPDAHIDTSDGLSVQEKWQELERLVDKEIEKLKEIRYSDS